VGNRVGAEDVVMESFSRTQEKSVMTKTVFQTMGAVQLARKKRFVL
jgi:hypothetical protein